MLFVSCVSHAFASVYCCLVVTNWERADLLALVYDVYCIYVTFPCGFLGQVWYLIVSIPDLCRLSYLFWNREFMAKVLNSSKYGHGFPIDLRISETDYGLYDSVKLFMN